MDKRAFSGLKRMKWVLLLLILICLSKLAYAANSMLEPDCTAPAGIQSTKTLAELPAPVLAALREHVPNLAPVESPFNGGDALGVGQTRPDRRFLSAFHKGARWAVAYEAAGRAARDVVVAFQLSSDTQKAQILANVQVLGPAVCSEMVRWINPDFPIGQFW